jgi:hypothetical protein
MDWLVVGASDLMVGEFGADASLPWKDPKLH